MLHIISQSPFATTLLDRIDAGDAVIFIENAVHCLYRDGRMGDVLAEKLPLARMYVLADDLEARGIVLQKLVPGINAVDYRGFVELTLENAVIQSWH